MNKILTTVISVCVLLGILWGGFIFFEYRYQTVMAAEKEKKNIEENSVKTFEMQQKIMNIQLKSIESKFERDQLDYLRTQLILLQKQQENKPSDLLKDKIDILTLKIKTLETKINNE